METVDESSLRVRASVLAAQSLARVSRLWRQRGLGTAFKALHRVPYFGTTVSRREFEPGNWFETEVFEPYWGPVILGGRPYEPELRLVMSRLVDRGVAWIDGGANYGYWSIVATGAAVGCIHAVAIEPSPPTLVRLEANRRLNGERFVIDRRALSDRTGNHVRLVLGAMHAATHIATSRDVASGGVDVETVTIDDLIDGLGWQGMPFVLKLDVEFNEIPAIRGSAKARSAAPHALIIEDWPMKKYPVAQHLLEIGYLIFHISSQGRCRVITDVKSAFHLTGAARGPKRPANFVATTPTGRFADALRDWERTS